MADDKDNQRLAEIVIAQKILTDAVLFALEKSSVASVNAALASLTATFLANMSDPHFSKSVFLTGMEGLFGLFTGAHPNLSPDEISVMLNSKLQQLLKQINSQSGN